MILLFCLVTAESCQVQEVLVHQIHPVWLSLYHPLCLSFLVRWSVSSGPSDGMGEKVSRMITDVVEHWTVGVPAVRCIPVVIVIVIVLLVTCNLVTSVSVTSSVVTFAWHVCCRTVAEGWMEDEVL